MDFNAIATLNRLIKNGWQKLIEQADCIHQDYFYREAATCQTYRIYCSKNNNSRGVNVLSLFP